MNTRAYAFLALAGVVSVTPTALAETMVPAPRSDALVDRLQAIALAAYPIQAERAGRGGDCDVVLFVDADGDLVESHVESCSSARFRRAAESSLATLANETGDGFERAPVRLRRVTLSWLAYGE